MGRRAAEVVRILIDGGDGPAPVVNLSGDLAFGMGGALLDCAAELAEAGTAVVVHLSAGPSDGAEAACGEKPRLDRRHRVVDAAVP
jgi:hypothetical protein